VPVTRRVQTAVPEPAGRIEAVSPQQHRGAPPLSASPSYGSYGAPLAVIGQPTAPPADGSLPPYQP